jgi:NAD dependent epimerase/dehydratase family enzyme
MQILVSGSTGLIGRALVAHLRDAGHEVTRLVRPGSPAGTEGIEWEPTTGRLDAERLEGFEAVVHLGGESINQRWTEATKDRILRSRVRGTELLAGALAELDDPPEVLVSAGRSAPAPSSCRGSLGRTSRALSRSCWTTRASPAR